MIATGTKVGVYLCPELAGTLMTPEEFDAVEEYDEEYRYELVHGVLAVTPIPLESESDPNEELGHWLRAYRELHPHGAALDRTLSERYIATSTGRRRADRVIWCGLGRRPDSASDVPAIAVEFLSSRRRDRRRDYEDKRREYLQAGVREYWIIDRFSRTMTVVDGPQANPRERLVGEADVYTTPLLPGFELPLGRLLNAADYWR